MLKGECASGWGCLPPQGVLTGDPPPTSTSGALFSVPVSPGCQAFSCTCRVFQVVADCVQCKLFASPHLLPGLWTGGVLDKCWRAVSRRNIQAASQVRDWEPRTCRPWRVPADARRFLCFGSDHLQKQGWPRNHFLHLLAQALSSAPMSPLPNKGFLSRKELGHTIFANKSNHCSPREGGWGREPGKGFALCLPRLAPGKASAHSS